MPIFINFRSPLAEVTVNGSVMGVKEVVLVVDSLFNQAEVVNALDTIVDLYCTC